MSKNHTIVAIAITQEYLGHDATKADVDRFCAIADEVLADIGYKALWLTQTRERAPAEVTSLLEQVLEGRYGNWGAQ